MSKSELWFVRHAPYVKLTDGTRICPQKELNKILSGGIKVPNKQDEAGVRVIHISPDALLRQYQTAIFIQRYYFENYKLGQIPIKVSDYQFGLDELMMDLFGKDGVMDTYNEVKDGSDPVSDFIRKILENQPEVNLPDYVKIIESSIQEFLEMESGIHIWVGSRCLVELVIPEREKFLDNLEVVGFRLKDRSERNPVTEPVFLNDYFECF